LTSSDPEAMIKRVADLILAEHLADAVDAPPAAAAAPPPAVEMDAAALAAYTGEFYSPELEVIYKLAVTDGQLTLSFGGQEPISLRPIATDHCQTDHFQDEGQRKLAFTRGENGAVAGFTLSTGRAWGVQFERASRNI
ncbi:MAG: DUF3471 domain-containing protein, partial [Caldilineaceae bacterium]|nr:DUF3471 domain-containing protein [Caldilineaceae bacterium]